LIKGILLKIKIHPLFWLVLGTGIITGHFREVLMMFSIVFIHEMGHGAAAHFFHWRINKIQLLPFGGVAETDEHGNRPLMEEFIVTVAGPLQHFVLWGAGFLLYDNHIWSEADYQMFFLHNMTILAFNLLPILPLDGGKLLQTACSYFCSYKKAIVLSLALSASVLLLLCLWSAYYYPFHLNLWGIIAFLWLSQFIEWRRRHYVYMRFLMGRYYAADKPLLKLKPIIVSAEERLPQVLSRFQKGVFHTVIVKNRQSRNEFVFEESKLLKAFFEEKKVQSEIGQLFR
jgi:stage IV sporulation protein FB